MGEGLALGDAGKWWGVVSLNLAPLSSSYKSELQDVALRLL